MDYPFRNLVFEGGGVKGIAYVGTMRVLESKGILQNISRVGGTSAGAINAAMFAAGYSNNEMLKVLKKLDFNDFKDDSWGAIKDLRRLGTEYGWYRGDYFRDWMGDLLKQKTGTADVTFKSLFESTNRSLYVYASNISTSFGEVYSYEHTPRMRVVDAVRRSMSIPLFFRAIRDDRDDVFVDGGAINNYPVKLFDRAKYIEVEKHKRATEYYDKENSKLQAAGFQNSQYFYNKETLGFRLDSAKEIGIFRDGQTPQSVNIQNFLDYSMQLIKTVMSIQDSQHLHSDDWQRTVYIDTKGISTFDFDLSDAKKNELVKSGKEGAEKYFEWWDGEHEVLPVNAPNSQT